MFFFNFENHGKLILTNNIVYWNSANFSDESVRNYECGTLSTDKKFIEYIHNILFPEIISYSIKLDFVLSQSCHGKSPLFVLYTAKRL